MKRAAVTLNRAAVIFLTGFTIITIAFSGLLYHRNQLYINSNRKLILQNDSIMSVNIELAKALEHKTALPEMLSVSENYKSSKPK